MSSGVMTRNNCHEMYIVFQYIELVSQSLLW